MAEGTQKILIAEDERPIAKALELKLKHEGYEVGVAFNGVEALESLKADAFDLVLIDIMMPEMDGFELLQKMKDDGITAPAIVLSNLSQVEDDQKAKELGAKDFFIKSNTPLADIIDYVKQVI